MPTNEPVRAWEINPPGGWRYGAYPKIVPNRYFEKFRYYNAQDAAFREFLRDNNYPDWLINSCKNWHEFAKLVKVTL